MNKSLKLVVESLLFSSQKPLTAREINALLPDEKLADIRDALKVLKYEYDAMSRSFEIREVSKGYQFRSRSEYGSYILKMLQTTPNRLSRAAMETLAIIAYKQPMIRHEIEKYRGVDVGGILRTLLEKELIKIVGRKELPGRPLIYGTTKTFLEVFDLKRISDLPKMKEIKEFGIDDYDPTPTGSLEEIANRQENGEAHDVKTGEFPEENQERDFFGQEGRSEEECIEKSAGEEGTSFEETNQEETNQEETNQEEGQSEEQSEEQSEDST